MALQHSNTADAWTPADYGKLVNIAVQAKSVAFKAATIHQTDKVKVNFPLWVSDPAVAWYNELDPIAATDGATGEIPVTPSKTAGIHRVSSELADDTDPAIADQIGAALANQIAEAVDTAWLANTTAKANSGLLSLAYSSVDTGVITAVANLDPFIAARFKAQSVGAELTSWVMSPATAELLSKVKLQTGSNQTLLQFVNDGLVVAGLPVYVSPRVDALTLAWGIPKQRVVTVLRKGTEVVRSKDAGFYNDALDIRAIARVGFAFLQPAAVVRLWDSP
jgi:HK97 family phage major capsid protein